MENNDAFDKISVNQDSSERQSTTPDAQSHQAKDTSRSGVEFGGLCRIIRRIKANGGNPVLQRNSIFEEMNAYSKWHKAPDAYKETTFKNALKAVNEDYNKQESLGTKPKPERIKLNFSTDHLPLFDKLCQIVGLIGDEYIPILKGLYYNLLGVVLSKKLIKQGNIYTCCRLPILIPLKPGGGKLNIRTAIDKVLSHDALRCDVHVPGSLHSQQLVGKVVKEGTKKNPEYRKAPGYLTRDYVVFEEAYKLLTCEKEGDLGESRRFVRMAKDAYLRNKIEKKLVDNTFDENQIISYFPHTSFALFTQPKRFPLHCIEEGDLRRDLILYNPKLLSFSSMSDEDFSKKMQAPPDVDALVSEFANFLKKCKKTCLNLDLHFKPPAWELLQKRWSQIVRYGEKGNPKERSYNEIMKYPILNFLAIFSVMSAVLKGRSYVLKEDVNTAFMDYFEMYTLSMWFVEDRVNGFSDFGTWKSGFQKRDYESIQWLMEQRAYDRESAVPYADFKNVIMESQKVGKESARKRANKMEKDNIISVFRAGQFDWYVFVNSCGNYLGGLPGRYFLEREYSSVVTITKTQNNTKKGIPPIPYIPYRIPVTEIPVHADEKTYFTIEKPCHPYHPGLDSVKSPNYAIGVGTTHGKGTYHPPTQKKGVPPKPPIPPRQYDAEVKEERIE